MTARVLVLLGLVAVACVACQGFKRAGDAALTPNPDAAPGTPAPVVNIPANLGKAVLLDPQAIASIVSDLTWIILAGFGLTAGTNVVMKGVQIRSQSKAISAQTEALTAEVPPVPAKPA